MSLCLFGGAFNPPHLTHQRVIDNIEGKTQYPSVSKA